MRRGVALPACMSGMPGLALLVAASPWLVACASAAAPGAPPPAVVELTPSTPAPEAAGPADDGAEGNDDPALAGMVLIAGETFTMGFSGCDGDEQPEHEVKVRGFRLDATEVTMDAYQACVDGGRCAPLGPPTRQDPEDDEKDQERCNVRHPDRGKHPVNCVTWMQADAYCRARGKRLPTEEEWELAARGPKGRAFPWGDTFDAERLCWNRADGTCAVGSYPDGDTPSGLSDMAGNVWEWTSTHYCNYTDPGCSDSGYVDRGGGWISDDPRLLHGAHRGRGEPDAAASYLGFRCARDR